MYVTDATPEPLRANRFHTPGAEAWFARSHASHSETEANESVSSGGPEAGTARTLRRDVLEAPVARLDPEHAGIAATTRNVAAPSASRCRAERQVSRAARAGRARRRWTP